MVRGLLAVLALGALAPWSHGESRAWVVTAAAFAWDETLPDGTRFVRERGARVTAGLIRPLPSKSPFEWAYEGAVYGTLARHQGWDVRRSVIAKGYENTAGGQIGTHHSLRGAWTVLPGDVALKLEAAAMVDGWYRPLSYYELWLVPSASYGLRAESKAARWSIFLGARSVVGPRLRTQTTHSPWNAARDTSIALHAETTPEVCVELKLDARRNVRVVYGEYRFRTSDITPLRPGFGIYQPASIQRSLTVGLVTAY